MPESDQLLEEDAGEATEPKEPKVIPKEPNSDPLDAIEDETVRAEMKRLRAIDQRQKNKPKESPKPTPAPLQEFIKKDELAGLVTSRAKEMVSDEVREHWDELLEIPLGGYNALDPDSIAKNMTQRLAILKVEPEKKPDPIKEIIATPGIRGGSGLPPKKGEKELPNFRQPVKPMDWIPEEYRK